MDKATSPYHRSQNLIWEGQRQRRAGDADAARRCFHEAAEIEEAHVRSLDPEQKPRSVAIYGAGAAWSRYRAGETELAAALLRDFGAAGKLDAIAGSSWVRLEEELAAPRLERHNPVFASAPAAFAEAEREHQAARPTAEERKKLRPLSV